MRSRVKSGAHPEMSATLCSADSGAQPSPADPRRVKVRGEHTLTALAIAAAGVRASHHASTPLNS